MEKNKVTLSEALIIFEENLEEVKSACADNVLAIIREENGPLREDIIRLRTEKLRNTLKRIVSYQQEKIRPTRNRITDVMIARAKEHPIEELYDGKLRRGVGLCPFHNEKTPSFSVKNNKFTCFGCGVYGDAIDFYMRTRKVGFLQAVRALQ